MQSVFTAALDRLHRRLTALPPGAPVDAQALPGLSVVPPVALSAPATGLLHLRLRAAGLSQAPRLRIDLGTGPLAADTVLALIARWQGPPDTQIAVRLETDVEGEVTHIGLGAFDALEQARAQMLLHEISPREPMTRDGARVALIVELPPHDTDLTLLDFRGMHRPAPAGPPAHGQTLARLARS